MSNNTRIIISHDGERITHIKGNAITDHDTLCGVDGDDPNIGHKIVKCTDRGKINCNQCYAIYRDAKALVKKFRESSFDKYDLR